MADFVMTLLMFLLVSIVVISTGLFVALCVLAVKIVKMFLEDEEDGK